MMLSMGTAFACMAGCQAPTVCHVTGANCAQVGAAIADGGRTEVARGLWGPFDHEIWTEPLRKRLSQGQDVTVRWTVDHLLASTDGQDTIKFMPVSGGCVVELLCEKKDNGLFGPALFSERYKDRERGILQKAYWAMKKASPAVAFRAEGSWQPSEPFLIELHKGSLWTAARGVPFNAVVKHFEAAGFRVDRRTSGGDRVELSGHFDRDPFDVLFQADLFTTVRAVSLDEKAVVKKQGDVVIVGLWARGWGQTDVSLGPVHLPQPQAVGSGDNAAALCNLLWPFSLNRSIQPVPPAAYAEEIQPSAGATTKP